MRHAHLGIGECFHTPGTIENTETGLSLLDVFLLTSAFEGTPNVVLEATCLGVPVVATEAGGTREAIEEGVTGHVVRRPTPRKSRSASLPSSATRNGDHA